MHPFYCQQQLRRIELSTFEIKLLGFSYVEEHVPAVDIFHDKVEGLLLIDVSE